MKVSSSKVRVVLDPPPFVPVTYVANAPITNSFGLKNEVGGGGGGAITCFEDTTGSPAKVATACDAMATTTKAINLFTGVVLTEIRLLFIGSSVSADVSRCSRICYDVCRLQCPCVMFLITGM